LDIDKARLYRYQGTHLPRIGNGDTPTLHCTTTILKVP